MIQVYSNTDIVVCHVPEPSFWNMLADICEFALMIPEQPFWAALACKLLRLSIYNLLEICVNGCWEL